MFTNFFFDFSLFSRFTPSIKRNHAAPSTLSEESPLNTLLPRSRALPSTRHWDAVRPSPLPHRSKDDLSSSSQGHAPRSYHWSLHQNCPQRVSSLDLKTLPAAPHRLVPKRPPHSEARVAVTAQFSVPESVSGSSGALTHTTGCVAYATGLFPHRPGGWKSEISGLAWGSPWVLARALFLACRRPPSVSSHGRERGLWFLLF